MKKKYEQTQEAKENFKSDILAYMLTDPTRVYTKTELAARFNMSERKVRLELEKIANFYPIRATAGRKGYSLIYFDNESSFDELTQANMDCFYQIKEIQSRIDSLKARMKPLIASMKVTQEMIVSYHNERK